MTRMRESFTYIVLLAILPACAESDILYQTDAPACGERIAFTATQEQTSGTSRGVVTDMDNLDVFAVSASMTGSSGTSVYFAHETYPLVSVGAQVNTSLSGQTHYWLGSDSRYDFFAYSPTTDMVFGEGIIDKFDFTVNDDVAMQSDIVVCSVLDASYGKTVPLRFIHPLSRISVSQGSQMAEGTIESVSFSGVVGKGSYDMRTGEWSVLMADSSTYTYKCSAAADPMSSITGSDYNFFFIPQTLGPDACLKVNFVDSLGVVHNYVKALSGEWKAGASYNYSLSISPHLNFVLEDSIADAYYSIVKVKVDAPGIMPGVEWGINVSASDGADVSVQWQENVNSFARLGFWTDNYLVDGNAVQSARGSSSTETVSGPFSDYVYVFLPENTGNADRTITISAVSGNDVLASAVITQKCPVWEGDVGWSQLDDGTLCDFGFSWNRSLAYVLPYSVSEYGLETDFSENGALTILHGMISLGHSSTYTDIETYYKYHIQNVGMIWHYYLYLDYSLCNTLAAGSRSDGYTNTFYLNSKGGTAATGAFELMITRAAQEMSSGQPLFRLPSASYSQENSVPRPSGVDNLSLSALNRVLKHNRFNYTVTHIGIAVLEYPSLASSDLVWYLPAVGQFGSVPSSVVDPVVPAACWSSTAVGGSSRAYLGNGAAALRGELARVRCCRVAVSASE